MYAMDDSISYANFYTSIVLPSYNLTHSSFDLQGNYLVVACSFCENEG